MPTDPAKLKVIRTHPITLIRDRAVVKMAAMIVTHFPNGSNETAYALLRAAARKKRMIIRDNRENSHKGSR
jgi:hypothetical protein